MPRKLFVLVLLAIGVAVSGCEEQAGKNALSGRVSYKGEPVRFATLVVTGADGKTAGGSTNDKGEYLIPDPPQGTLRFQFITARSPRGAAASAGPTTLPRKYAQAGNGVTVQYTGGKLNHDIDLAP